MRRKDREVASFDAIVDILARCDIVRLGLSDGGVPYIVPMSFGHAVQNGVLTLYFHAASEGRKIDILQKNPHVCFEADCSYKLKNNPVSGTWTAEYESVIGYGNVHFIDNVDDKHTALVNLMHHYSPDATVDYPPSLLGLVCKIVAHRLGRSFAPTLRRFF